MRRRLGYVAIVLIMAASTLLQSAGAVAGQSAGDRYERFDHVLDTYVREGYVYYKALQSERRVIDPYLQSLETAPPDMASWSRNDQLAFWINAYNALVLKTVIDKYPIKTITKDYPANSIRQIPGALEQITHRVAGRSLTLNAIEQTIIVPFGDARALLALGRGAIGSGRLHSEVYRGDRLDEQLDQVVKEFSTRINSIKVDPPQSALTVSPLFGWRQDAFVASFQKDGAFLSGRSPIEQAIVGMVLPKLFTTEREFLKQNTFQLKYGVFDWRLNDLTGGIPN